MRFLRHMIALLPLLWCTSALADVEGWSQVDARIGMWRSANKEQKLSLKLYGDARFNGRRDGFHIVQLEAMPIYSPVKWFYLGVGLKYQGEVMADHSMVHEVRLEFEPGFQVQLGLVKLVNRHRMELRYYPGQLPNGYRYRTRVQMVLGDETWPVLPQVSNEIFVAIAPTAFNQNRLIAGVWIPMGKIPRLELAYMFRSRLAADKWEHDHVIVFGFGVSAG